MSNMTDQDVLRLLRKVLDLESKCDELQCNIDIKNSKIKEFSKFQDALIKVTGYNGHPMNMVDIIEEKFNE